MASYYVYSGAGGSNNGSSWANAFTTLTTAYATEVAGDTLYVAHDHSESTGSAVTLTSSGTITVPTKVICVNRAGSVPPVSADRRATAQVATTGNFGISFVGSAHYDGIMFVAGNSTGIANLTLSVATAFTRFDNCSMRLGGTSNSSRINIGQSTGGAYVEFNNTTVSFASVNQNITVGAAFKWRNTPSAVLGSVPNTLISNASGWGGEVECIGVDFSALGSGKTIASPSNAASVGLKYRFVDCKLGASVTKATNPPGAGAAEVDFIRAASSGVNYTVSSYRTAGTLTEETTIVRAGGASDGTTPISWKVVTTADCHYSVPFQCPPIAIWNDTTGSAVTATVEGIWGGGAVPNDDDVWLDVDYLGDASSPQGSFVNDGKADLLATAAAQTSSSETWGGSTTKFKLAVTFTPQQKGWLYARVKCAKASSTFYIDPLVTLT
jgi:hypothetical protein